MASRSSFLTTWAPGEYSHDSLIERLHLLCPTRRQHLQPLFNAVLCELLLHTGECSIETGTRIGLCTEFRSELMKKNPDDTIELVCCRPDQSHLHEHSQSLDLIE